MDRPWSADAPGRAKQNRRSAEAERSCRREIPSGEASWTRKASAKSLDTRPEVKMWLRATRDRQETLRTERGRSIPTFVRSKVYKRSRLSFHPVLVRPSPSSGPERRVRGMTSDALQRTPLDLRHPRRGPAASHRLSRGAS